MAKGAGKSTKQKDIRGNKERYSTPKKSLNRLRTDVVNDVYWLLIKRLFPSSEEEQTLIQHREHFEWTVWRIPPSWKLFLKNTWDTKQELHKDNESNYNRGFSQVQSSNTISFRLRLAGPSTRSVPAVVSLCVFSRPGRLPERTSRVLFFV